MPLTIDQIIRLYRTEGAARYGMEAIDQEQHALQCAQLAQEAGARPALVAAALLHDLGHLLHELGASPTLQGVDDLHQYRAIPFLRGLFRDEVVGAIRSHVDAKRYLCAVDANYHAALSDDSRRSLVLQGGAFDAAQADAFIARPGAGRAVRLRIWDDRAKAEGLTTPPLAHYLQRARRCALTP